MDENTNNEDIEMETTESCNNYSSCCRLCLMDDNINSLKSIFDDEMDSQAIVEKIFDFLGIEVSKFICFSILYKREKEIMNFKKRVTTISII